MSRYFIYKDLLSIKSLSPRSWQHRIIIRLSMMVAALIILIAISVLGVNGYYQYKHLNILKTRLNQLQQLTKEINMILIVKKRKEFLKNAANMNAITFPYSQLSLWCHAWLCLPSPLIHLQNLDWTKDGNSYHLNLSLNATTKAAFDYFLSWLKSMHLCAHLYLQHYQQLKQQNKLIFHYVVDGSLNDH